MMKLCVHGGSTVTAYTVPELLCGGYARLEKETTIRGHKVDIIDYLKCLITYELLIIIYNITMFTSPNI